MRHLERVRRPDDRCRGNSGEESPGSTETRCRVTPGGGNPRESATESSLPAGAGATRPAGEGERVRQERTAAPATAAARQTPPGARPSRDDGAALRRGAGRFPGRVVRVGRARRLATGVPEEWSSHAPRGMDRTRLTGRLIRIHHARAGLFAALVDRTKIEQSPAPAVHLDARPLVLAAAWLPPPSQGRLTTDLPRIFRLLRCFLRNGP
jgi:hypothetical protein